MASKASSPRKGTPTRQTARAAGVVTSTPIERTPQPQQGPSTAETPERPVSPGLIARDNEKKQLSHLNNRLAIYIDHVNRLQTENQRLQTSVRRIEEKKSTEVTSIKKTYEREIAALRNLVDDEAKIRATAQAEADSIRKQLDRTNAVNHNLQSDFDRVSRRVNDLEKENADIKAKYQNSLILADQRAKELTEAKKQLKEAENSLKDATVENATLRNRLETAREETKLVKETSQKQLQEARVLTEEEITEIDGRAQERANTEFQQKIEEFRNLYDVTRQQMRERFEEELEQRLAGFVPAGEHAQLESQMKSLSQELICIKSDLEEKRRLLQQERSWNSQQLQLKDEQIGEANARFRELQKEFDDLLDIKDSLQKELDTYRTLLEQEESRLNISSAENSARSPTSILSSASRKRRRLSSAFESTQGEENAECLFNNVGPLSVVDHDAIHGKFVVLENTSDEDMQLGGWKIFHKSGEVEANHKFPQRFRIKAHTRITLWSSDSGATHNPPTDYVLKGISFPSNANQSGELEVTTIVMNGEDQVMAKRISKQRKVTRTSTYRLSSMRGTPQRVSFAPGEVFHSDGDNTMNDSRCSIM